MLDNTTNQPSKFRRNNWVHINDDLTYNTNSQIRYKPIILKSSLCNYSDAYIFVEGNITVAKMVAAGAAANISNKNVVIKNCIPFTESISKINNTQADNAKEVDVVMPMYSLIEYIDNYLKISGSL